VTARRLPAALSSHVSSSSISPTLTTGKSGSLEGKNLRGEPGALLTTGVSGTVVANEFAVGSVDPSSACPPGTAERLNTTLGLPLAAGQSSFVANFSYRLRRSKSRVMDLGGQWIATVEGPVLEAGPLSIWARLPIKLREEGSALRAGASDRACRYLLSAG
jgi:hypothetical protein